MFKNIEVEGKQILSIMDRIDIFIELLKSKEELTQLERDILDTCNEYRKQPIDWFSSRKKILENVFKYVDIYEATVKMSIVDILLGVSATEQEIRKILFTQLDILINKELK